MTFATHDKALFRLEADNLQRLFDALVEHGYELMGPTIRQNAIVYDTISGVDDLPRGWTDEQDAGTYRLEKSSKDLFFDFASCQDSWKKVLAPSIHRPWNSDNKTGNSAAHPEPEEPRQIALIGVRACDLRAIQIQDKAFMGGPCVNAHYKVQRDRSFILAVNCGKPGGTCFCLSMGTGPAATGGFDLALTEIMKKSDHYFLIETGSTHGAEILNAVPHKAATEEEKDSAIQVIAKASERMGRTMETRDLRALLTRNFENPRWEETTRRCLSCANCTLVCPTCFCSTAQNMTDLSGQKAEHWRKLDSCFLLDFSYINGGSIRAMEASRYRQWITHKLATWTDQFGTLGCVGCGRCITWCPVGIDITEEIKAIRESERNKKKLTVPEDCP